MKILDGIVSCGFVALGIIGSFIIVCLAVGGLVAAAQAIAEWVQ